jgi:hypothetical protein
MSENSYEVACKLKSLSHERVGSKSAENLNASLFQEDQSIDTTWENSGNFGDIGSTAMSPPSSTNRAYSRYALAMAL